jgi:hypothetical protein
MFVQVIHAQVADAEAARAAFEEWGGEASRGAIGWLGSTAGITDDGQLVVVARFSSEEEARRNVDRPEQGDWWNRLAASLAGEATFTDCTDVDVLWGGGSDDAGFVQVIEGEIADPASAQAMIDEMNATSPADMGRKDVLGALIARHPDGRGFTQVVYFTDEESAREGETAEDPEQTGRNWEGFENVRFYDLRDPILASAAG